MIHPAAAGKEECRTWRTDGNKSNIIILELLFCMIILSIDDMYLGYFISDFVEYLISVYV